MAKLCRGGASPQEGLTVSRPSARRAGALPTRRRLRIFSSDPLSGVEGDNRATIDIPDERLLPGPMGGSIQVIDYDAEHDRYYPPVDLEARDVLMRDGLEPSESNPQFHQQMVYAVAMRVLENYETALGRIGVALDLKEGKNKLRIFPHAFHGANAFYDHQLHALLFGYFRANRAAPGRNLPDQLVFTCLSHDIIAHEMTHALTHQLRPHFLDPSNEDVLAFHEGFADLVALLQHFSYPDVLREQIQRRRADLRGPGLLVELARQFGHATGTGRALRSALDRPDKKLYETVTEPHERGAFLVAAVFDAFFTAYQSRIRDLVRIATGGSGNLPDADLHPDLVKRVAGEAARTAQAILRMAIRAFDYLPPVDITFGDYLRALITADRELNPIDNLDLRAAMIEGFRLRGIYPSDVPSLAEDALAWEEAAPKLPRFPSRQVDELVPAARSFGHSAEAVQPHVHAELREYAYGHAKELALDRDRLEELEVEFHTVFRVGRDGQLLIELVAQFVQEDESHRSDLGGLPLRGGTTVVAAADGTVRYVIAKPLPSARLGKRLRRQARERLERQRVFVRRCALADPRFAWGATDYPGKFMLSKMNLAALHLGVV
jgi:hypothetical protein